MIIEVDNKKRTAVEIGKHKCFFGSNNAGYYDYKMFAYKSTKIDKAGNGFTKRHKLINKIKR